MIYEDVIVFYVLGKTAACVNEKLNSDFSRLNEQFHENLLIINLSEGNTKALLF